HQPELSVEVRHVEFDRAAAIGVQPYWAVEQGNRSRRDGRQGTAEAGFVTALADRAHRHTGPLDQPPVVVSYVEAQLPLAEIVPVGRRTREVGQLEDALVDGRHGDEHAAGKIARDGDGYGELPARAHLFRRVEIDLQRPTLGIHCYPG